MTFLEALQRLSQNKVKSFLYVNELGGLGGGECIGMERTDAGWVVYCSERGSKSFMKRFDTESEAAEYFVQQVEKEYSEYVENLKSRGLPIPDDH